MVGNLDEWVADWVPLSTDCSSWGGLSDDLMCLFGASTTGGGPGALLRGGDFRTGPSAGPLAVVSSGEPQSSRGFIGFRCAR
jgi:formylglycine-generating enzyme required for sulfatase activity